MALVSRIALPSAHLTLPRPHIQERTKHQATLNERVHAADWINAGLDCRLYAIPKFAHIFIIAFQPILNPHRIL